MRISLALNIPTTVSLTHVSIAKYPLIRGTTLVPRFEPGVLRLGGGNYRNEPLYWQERGYSLAKVSFPAKRLSRLLYEFDAAASSMNF